ncbi:MAG: hypothetical protein ACRC7G_13110 [Beijerinckiaceae bacterium]
MTEIRHRGEAANDLGQRIKAMLAPLEDVCRYREQRDSDTARFDVKPKGEAMPFRIDIAPGGINILCEAFSIHEMPLEQSDVAAAFVEAILAGRLRRVSHEAVNGKLIAEKTYVFAEDGRLIYRHRRKKGLPFVPRRKAITRRQRFAAYRTVRETA